MAKDKAGRIPLTLRDSSKRSEEKTKSSHMGCTRGWDPGQYKPRLWITTEQGEGDELVKRAGWGAQKGRQVTLEGKVMGFAGSLFVLFASLWKKKSTMS